ncbi:MAG: DUF433 domain-containing protein [Bacteroidota bacterium]
MEITEFYGGSHPSEVPFYTQRDVAMVCGVPARTLGDWLRPTESGGMRDELIVGPGGPDGRLSFQNLVEAYIVRLMQDQGGVPTRRLRNFVVAERDRGVDRPFLRPDGYWVGTGVYRNVADDLVDASEWQQYVLRPIVERYVDRIQYEEDRPVELFPTYPGSDSRAIRIDPRVRFGRPTIDGTGIKTATVWERAKAGETIRAIAEGYGLDEDLAAEAYRYEVSRRAA